MAVQSETAFKESLHYWNTHVIAGGTYYMTLVTGSLFPVGNSVITSSSTLGGLTEVTGGGFARVSFTLGADTNGVMAIPQVVFTMGSGGGSANAAAAVMCSAASAGVGLYCWDLSAVRDMSSSGTTLTIPTLNIFTENPGGV